MFETGVVEPVESPTITGVGGALATFKDAVACSAATLPEAAVEGVGAVLVSTEMVVAGAAEPTWDATTFACTSVPAGLDTDSETGAVSWTAGAAEGAGDGS